VAIQVWYYVNDLDDGLAFYRDQLGFEEVYRDDDERWVRLHRDAMEIAVAEGAAGDYGVAIVDVADIKAEAERLRSAGVKVGTIVELLGEMRLLDVLDPDGNRIQLVQALN
jgi:catechol 2,3-dioxygenase-like lactoylglutathione lyase family enzyme